MMPEADIKWCTGLLRTLQNSRNKEKCKFFLVPVVTVLDAAEIAIYRSIISNPKDLGTMEQDLLANKYTRVEEFISDAILCFDNAILYNKSRYVFVASAAESLKKVDAYASTASNIPLNILLILQVVKAEEAKYLKAREVAAAAKASPAVVNVPIVTKAEPVIFIAACKQALGMLTNMDTTALFREPVDCSLFVDYPVRIDNPMDFGTIGGMLSDDKIKKPSEFAQLVRRVFANCLIYNYQLRGDLGAGVKAIRQRVREMLTAFEDSWKVKFPDIAPSCPFAKECLHVIEELLKLPSVGVDLQAIDKFMDPLPKYFGGEYPAGYLEVISSPMSMATVTSNVVEGHYRTPNEFKRDVLFIFSNCETYMHSERGFYDTELEQDAKTLRKKFNALFDTHLGRFCAATAATKRKAAAEEEAPRRPVAPAAVPKKKADPEVIACPVSSPIVTAAPAPPALKPAKIVLKDKFMFCCDEVKEHYIEVQVGKVFTADFFLKAVDPTKYEGYAELVMHPMCLTIVEKKVRADRYRTMGDILKDIYLVRHNTYVYNTGGAGLEIRILADHFVHNFSYLLTLVGKGILRMHELVKANTPAAIKASIDAAVGAMSDDFKLLIQVYHGIEQMPAPKEAKVRVVSQSPRDLYASISDEFFKQPHFDGISKEYERPTAPTDEILQALHSFYKYDPATLNLVAAAVQPPPAPPTFVQVSPVKATMKRESSNSAVALPPAEATAADVDYAQPVRGGKSAGKGAKKRRRPDVDEEPSYEEEVATAPIDMEENMEIIVSVARPPSEWEQSCQDILKKILKHDFVDITKPTKAGSIVSNFVAPVIELYPQVTESYLALIETPMDLTIISNRLDDHAFLDCEDFYEKMVLVFQNAIDYNKPHMGEGEYAQKLVPRCEHMIRYIKWLCLEFLPTADDTDAAEPESLGFLRKSVVDAERLVRIAALRNQPIDNVKECTALIKKFDQKKTTKQYSYFSTPVSIKDVPNYSTFVRKPMDFSTVKEKLEFGRYPSYMSFIEDIQLIFSNAKRFNGAFKESDTFSQIIYDAATMFEERLESILYKEFSIDVLERLYWNGIRYAEDEKLRLEHLKKMEKQRSEDSEFRDRETARLKSIDSAFAIDQDRELKRSHALDGLLHSSSLSEAARRTIGLFSDSAMCLPSVEERQEGWAEVTRRRDDLFDTAWANWSGASGLRRFVSRNRLDTDGEGQPTFDILLRSPPKIRSIASLGALQAMDTDDGLSVRKSASDDTLCCNNPGELVRPNGSGKLKMMLRGKASQCSGIKYKQRLFASEKTCIPACFCDESAVEEHTTAMEWNYEAVTQSGCATSGDATMNGSEHNVDNIGDHALLPPPAYHRAPGVKIHCRRIGSSSTSEPECEEGIIVVVEYLLSTGVSLCRVLSPRTPCAVVRGQLNFIGRQYAIGAARFTTQGSVMSESRRFLNLSGDKSFNTDCDFPQPMLGDAINSLLHNDSPKIQNSDGVDKFDHAIFLGGYVDSEKSSSDIEWPVDFLLQPYIQRAEGGQVKIRKSIGVTMGPKESLEDELLFKMLTINRNILPRHLIPTVLPCHPYYFDDRERVGSFGGICHVPMRRCGGSHCLVSSCFECVDMSYKLNQYTDIGSDSFLQHWILVGEPTEIRVEIINDRQVYTFAVCGVN